jgi:hypothetical protein
VTLAHIAGVPVEESLLMLAPVLPLLVLGVRARVARVAGQLRRGHAAGRDSPEQR